MHFHLSFISFPEITSWIRAENTDDAQTTLSHLITVCCSVPSSSQFSTFLQTIHCRFLPFHRILSYFSPSIPDPAFPICTAITLVPSPKHSRSSPHSLATCNTFIFFLCILVYCWHTCSYWYYKKLWQGWRYSEAPLSSAVVRTHETSLIAPLLLMCDIRVCDVFSLVYIVLVLTVLAGLYIMAIKVQIFCNYIKEQNALSVSLHNATFP